MSDVDIDPTADPDRMARCPLRLLGDGPRCRSLVLVRDAQEHAQWHRWLDDALQSVPEAADGVEVAAWPQLPAAAAEEAPAAGSGL